MTEIDNMLDRAEDAFELGGYLTNDDVFRNNEKLIYEDSLA